MNHPTTRKLRILTGILGCAAALAQAQDPEEPEDATAQSPGQERVTQSIADQFEEFAGENSTLLVEALRTGSELSYDVETQVDVEVPVLDADGNPVFQTDADGNQVLDDQGNPIPETMIEQQTVVETVVVENTVGPQGFGNARISMLLAEEMLAQGGMEGSMENIAGSLFGTDPEVADGILEMRADGAGWGEITQDLLGTNLGSLMSAKNPGHRTAQVGSETGRTQGRPEQSDGPQGAGRPDRGNRSPRAERSGRPENRGGGRPVTTERPGRPEQAGRPERLDRPERVNRPERPERVNRPERPERPERVNRPERPERPDRPGR